MHPDHDSRCGFTVVEVIVAIAVLGATVATVAIGLSAGDRMRGRRMIASYGTMLAESEAERIKAEAELADSITDSTYDAVVNKQAYTVIRSVVPQEDVIIGPGPRLQELEITVQRRGMPDTVAHVRLVQGFLAKREMP